MDSQSAVVFRNVGQLYFPQTRVECHYSLTPGHQWSSSDWIGIFQMGWTSLKQYHTYTWALVPEGYAEGTSVDCCANFQASYLPRPSAVEFQFVYVDKTGTVCARSRPFTFCAPKPLEELETLKEEQDGEDGDEELLLVVPRAQLLQSRLEESLQRQADLQGALEKTKREAEEEKESIRGARTEWESERDAMREEITELRDNLRHSCELLKKLEGKHQDVRYSEENLSSELSKLLAEKAGSQQQVRDLQEDIKALTDRETRANKELERLKERVKKMSSQMKHDEEKRKSLQVEAEASAAEVRGLQERLEATDLVSEGLRRELRELGARQSHANAELHQARLQVAQLTLQLSDQDLILREERANSALEREAYKHAAEIDKKKLHDLSCELMKKEDWLQEERMERDNLESEIGKEKVLLSTARRELQELRADVRKVQKEREEEQLHKQEVMNYVQQLEQKLGIVPETKLNSSASSHGYPDSSSEPDEDASSASSRSVSSPLFLTSHLEDGAETPSLSEGDEPELDEDKQSSKSLAAEGNQLVLPELIGPVLSELAESPMW
ncbi:calcium-binding and coiled-coil domain-containing protein 1b [Austrofundulus limnaeus]|uniref:Calcium-binding and coiled-coil domain-containing protein 1b n=1 Tax=Austrofundulus limnaeus TaxID=52670 RepID=A0A2I4BA62_AUSLI|nr:PREDICTED: calcium-binding and coiled-coil domain-containing protein 1-like [Austrofundulus limnaeus]